MTISLKMEHI